MDLLRHGILGDQGDQRAKALVFAVVFASVYLLSGILTVATSGLYRMGLVSALVVPLLILYGLTLDFPTVAFLGLALSVSLSALVNGSSMRDLFLFLRIPAFGFLMYYLAKLVLIKSNIKKVLRVCVLISVVQLPIMLLQNVLVGGHDADFGTFNIKTDYALAFFAILVVIVLLFLDPGNPTINRRLRWPVLTWLALTVLSSNAQIVKLILIAVWGVYLVIHHSSHMLLKVTSSLILVSLALVVMFHIGLLSENPLTFVERIPGLGMVVSQRVVAGDSGRSYLAGGYDRAGAIRYFMSHPVSWFGDGPMKYYDVFTRTFTRGNMSHVFNFYSETGLVSLLLSIAVFFGIAFVPRWRPRWSMVGVLIFAAINILAFTSHVMNDIAVMLIYAIVGRAQWLLMDGEPASPPGDP
jgi:hypothetical protein